MSDAITIPVAAIGLIANAAIDYFRARAIERRLATVEASERDCMQRLFREIERGAQLAAIKIDPLNPPESLPPPDWDEPTPLRNVRAELEARGLAAGVRALLAEYLEATPPRVRMRSRPG